MREIIYTLVHMESMRFFLLTVLILQSFFGVSQQMSNATYYSWYDSIVGIENTPLYNAVSYVNTDIVLSEKNKLLYRTVFPKGLLTYDGQPYHDISLNYDVYNDVVLMQVSIDSEMLVAKLHTDMVERFTLEGRHFINPAPTHSNLTDTGFFEVLGDRKGALLLKKHKKRRHKRLQNKTVSYEFLDATADYYILYSNTLYSFDRKRDLKALFPNLNDAIQDLQLPNNLKRNDPDLYMRQLFNRVFL